MSRSIPRYFHDGVRSLVCGPKPFHRELLQCVFDGKKFKLVKSFVLNWICFRIWVVVVVAG